MDEVWDDQKDAPYCGAEYGEVRAGECECPRCVPWGDDPNHPEGVDCDGYPLSSGERCGRSEHRVFRPEQETPMPNAENDAPRVFHSTCSIDCAAGGRCLNPECPRRRPRVIPPVEGSADE